MNVLHLQPVQADLFIVRPVTKAMIDGRWPLAGVYSYEHLDHKTELINDWNPPRILRYGNSPRYLAQKNFEPIVRIFCSTIVAVCPSRSGLLYNIVT